MTVQNALDDVDGRTDAPVDGDDGDGDLEDKWQTAWNYEDCRWKWVDTL